MRRPAEKKTYQLNFKFDSLVATPSILCLFSHKRPRYLLLLCSTAIVFFVILFAPYMVQAQDDTTSNPIYSEVDLLTRKILSTEFELQRLNTHFRMESTRQDKWRPWRQFGYAEANAIMTEAGLIEVMALTYPRMHRPPHVLKKTTTVDKKTGKKTTKVSIERGKGRPVFPGHAQTAQLNQAVGQLIGSAGDIFEMGLNFYNYRKQAKRGFDPVTYRKRVQVLTKQLDDLFAAREQAMQRNSDLTPDQLDVARAEGRILKDVRDLTMLQYSEYHSSAQRLRFFQNAAYGIDCAKNAVGAAGNLINLEASHLRHPKMVGGAGVCTLISGVLIVATPIFGRVAGNLAGSVDRRIVNGDFANVEARDTRAFLQDSAALEQLMVKARLVETGQQGDLLNRKQIYDREREVLIRDEQNIDRERKLARATTRENVLFGAIVGSSKISLGVDNILAGWVYYDRPWIGARLGAAGSTAYGAGTDYAILENARVRLTQEARARKQRREHVAPGQILADRLVALDDMEKILNVGATPIGSTFHADGLPLALEGAGANGAGMTSHFYAEPIAAHLDALRTSLAKVLKEGSSAAEIY